MKVKSCRILLMLIACIPTMNATGSEDGVHSDPSGESIVVSRKTIVAAVDQAIKKVGVNIRGIQANARAIRSSVELIKTDVDQIQRSLRLSKSPMLRIDTITSGLNDFRVRAGATTRLVVPASIIVALSDKHKLSEMAKKFGSTAENLTTLYNVYDALIIDIDAVEIRPILQHVRKLLHNLTGVLDSALQLREYAGTRADNVISGNVASIVKDISQSIRSISNGVQGIMRGMPRSLRPVRSELADALISRLASVQGLIEDLKNSTSLIQDKMKSLSDSFEALESSEEKVIASVDSIKQNLENMVIGSLAGAELNHEFVFREKVIDVSQIANTGLDKVITTIHGEVADLLKHTVAMLGTLNDVARHGLRGIDAFKTRLLFDVVSPHMRAAINGLPARIQELSTHMNKLNPIPS